jgi:GT2 family glycosyltransferase
MNHKNDGKLPLITIGVVNYNSGEKLAKCIEAINKNTNYEFELIIVDNNSNDSSLNTLRELESTPSRNIFVIRNSSNFGPAKACNQIIKKARGEYVAILAADTIPSNNWLHNALELFKNDKRLAIVQCKLIHKETNLIDSVGDFLGNFGFLVHIVEPCKERDYGQYDNIKYIFSIKSAASILRRDIVLELNGFDEDYFIFYEETDLCWRAWLMGYHVALAPRSVVYHSWGSSVSRSPIKSYLIYYHGTKNHLTTLLKNCETRSLIILFPLAIFVWLTIGFSLSFRRRSLDAIYVLNGIAWTLKNIKKIIPKRKIIQSRSKGLPRFLIRRMSLIRFFRMLKEY